MATRIQPLPFVCRTSYPGRRAQRGTTLIVCGRRMVTILRGPGEAWSKHQPSEIGMDRENDGEELDDRRGGKDRGSYPLRRF